MSDRGEKREAQLTREQVEEYRTIQTLAWETQATADYFQRRRRQLEDEFAQLLGFKDRIDAKRQTFALQIYLHDRMVRAHNKNTTATVSLGLPLTPGNMYVHNKSKVTLYLGEKKEIRPRDGKTMVVEPGGSLQFPGRTTELFMAADSAAPLQVRILEIDDRLIEITVEDPA